MKRNFLSLLKFIVPESQARIRARVKRSIEDEGKALRASLWVLEGNRRG